jgi:hypothetical protein
MAIESFRNFLSPSRIILEYHLPNSEFTNIVKQSKKRETLKTLIFDCTSTKQGTSNYISEILQNTVSYGKPVFLIFERFEMLRMFEHNIDTRNSSN